VYVFGDVHALQAPPSSWHSKVAPESGELKVSVALEPGDRTGGAESTVVLGACVSTVNERVAGEASVLPAASVARTDTLCAPSLSALVVHGLVQVAHDPESTRHWNVEPLSVAVNANVGVLSLVGPLGPEPIVVSGAVVSGGGAVLTVNVRLAGVASVLPATSVARIVTVCEPSLSALVVHGLVQVAHDPESTRRWNVEPLTVAVNAKVGVLSFVVPVGPEVIVVSGAVVSGGGGAEATVTAFIVLSVSPSASATVTRTFLTPGSWKVNAIVLPVPSGHCPPAGPSVPSSSQVYVQGVSSHVALEASNETACPAVGEAGL
jgi:hypothetical protein